MKTYFYVYHQMYSCQIVCITYPDHTFMQSYPRDLTGKIKPATWLSSHWSIQMDNVPRHFNYDTRGIHVKQIQDWQIYITTKCLRYQVINKSRTCTCRERNQQIRNGNRQRKNCPCDIIKCRIYKYTWIAYHSNGYHINTGMDLKSRFNSI